MSVTRRILIVRDRPSAGGGIFNYYQAIGKHMDATVHFVDVGKPQRFYSSSRRLIARFTLLRLLADGMRLVLKIIRFRPDLVHINPGLDVATCRSLRRDAVNVWIARFFRRRVLVFWRGWNNAWCGKPEFPGGNNSVLCRTYKLAVGHIVLSQRFRSDLLRWGFTTPIHVETTVVADDVLNGNPDKMDRASRTDLLYLSRVEVAKGVFELLDVYRILKRKNQDYTLTIAGSGPDLDALRARARSMELNDISFPGFVTGGARLKSYRRGGIFCFLSYTEGMPNAVLEAMAMGLPIVSSDAGGLRDILRDGTTGFIVHPVKNSAPRERFDAVEVADAIERLANDATLYQRIAAHNAAYARERFAAPRVAQRLEAIYQSIPVRSNTRSGRHVASTKSNS